MADTRRELEAAVFDLAASVASVRAALSAAITDDGDTADRLDLLEGCHRVLADAMGSMWAAWARFDQGQMRDNGRLPKDAPAGVSAIRLS
jgi:hypothetical protein